MFNTYLLGNLFNVTVDKLLGWLNFKRVTRVTFACLLAPAPLLDSTFFFEEHFFALFALIANVAASVLLCQVMNTRSVDFGYFALFAFPTGTLAPRDSVAKAWQLPFPFPPAQVSRNAQTSVSLFVYT